MQSKTKLRLPFDGQWLVFWGGDTKELNAHHANVLQKHALDFVINKDGKSHRGDCLENKDYFAFGQDILAAADGKVVEVVDGVRDNTPGDTNHYFLPGNYVLIKHSPREFSFTAHLRTGSVVVRVGDSVTTGQKLGQCGNSGNSYEPHLHFHLQDSFIFGRFINGERKDVAKAIKVYFEDTLVEKNGQKIAKESHSPIKGEAVEQA